MCGRRSWRSESRGKNPFSFFCGLFRRHKDITLWDESESLERGVRVRDCRGKPKEYFGLMCMFVTVRLRALKAKIAAHKKELEELDKNVYVSRPLPLVRTEFRLLVSNSFAAYIGRTSLTKASRR